MTALEVCQPQGSLLRFVLNKHLILRLIPDYRYGSGLKLFRKRLLTPFSLSGRGLQVLLLFTSTRTENSSCTHLDTSRLLFSESRASAPPGGPMLRWFIILKRPHSQVSVCFTSCSFCLVLIIVKSGLFIDGILVETLTWAYPRPDLSAQSVEYAVGSNDPDAQMSWCIATAYLIARPLG